MAFAYVKESKMKLCITAKEATLDAQIDPRFGRCAFFIFIDSETMEFEAVDNAALSTAGGAGIKAGTLVSERNAQAVLTGSAGPNAYQVLAAAGIDVYTGVTGSIADVVRAFNAGELQKSSGPNVQSHSGLSR